MMKWSSVAPKLLSQRKALAKKCGVGKAFLDPEHLAYPVIRTPRDALKHTQYGVVTTCDVDCKGLQAAYNRAKQQHKPAIAAKAQRFAKRYGCPVPGRTR